MTGTQSIRRPAARLHGAHEGGVAAVVLEVGIRVRCEQYLDHVHQVLPCRDDQRRGPPFLSVEVDLLIR